MRGRASCAAALLLTLTFAGYVTTKTLIFPEMLGLIWCLGRSRGPFARLLGSRPMVLLGNASFAIYILHFPLQRWFVFASSSSSMSMHGRSATLVPLAPPHLASPEQFYLFLAGLVIVSIAAWTCFERPVCRACCDAGCARVGPGAIPPARLRRGGSRCTTERRPDMNRTSAPADGNRNVEAMRGVAAMIVAYFHGRVIAWVGIHQFASTHGLTWSLDSVLAYVTIPMVWGSIGVPVFFVISGYCIHRNHAAKHARDPHYRLDARDFCCGVLSASTGAAVRVAADPRARPHQPAVRPA